MSTQWSEYWKQGYITSFGGEFKDNYQGEIKSLWQRFSESQLKHSRILDIGTGNGALIDLLQKYSEHKCIGIDLADINIDITKNINGAFFSNVAAENLPFENESFDAVISQFALEYSNIDESIHEIYRVLCRGGRFQFVCHVQNSIITSPNLLTLKAAQRVKTNAEEHLSNLVDGIMKKKPTLDFEKALTEFIEIESALDINAILNTNFPSFFSFLLKNRNQKINFYKAYKLFVNELDKLTSRLTELNIASKNTDNLLKNIILKENMFIKVRSKNLVSQNGVLAIIINGEKY